MIYLIILYYETYKKIIKQEKINFLCFYSGSDILSKCAIAAAHDSRIKSLHVCHGFSIPKRNPNQPPSVYFAAFGHNFKKKFIQLGVNPNKIFVTGPTFMDEIVPYVKKTHKMRKEKRVLLATGNFVEIGQIDKKTYTGYITKFLREANVLPNMYITIKKHPRETEIDYNSLVTSLGYHNVKIVGGLGKNQLKSKLYDLIWESDIVFSFGSTVSREAIIMGKPSPIIDLSSVPFEDDRTKIRHISPEENLSIIIRDILFDPRRREEILEKQEEFVEEYFYKVDGKSGERVVEKIKELLGKE